MRDKIDRDRDIDMFSNIPEFLKQLHFGIVLFLFIIQMFIAKKPHTVEFIILHHSKLSHC